MSAYRVAKMMMPYTTRQLWELIKEIRWRNEMLEMNPLVAFIGAKNIMEEN